MIKKKSVKKIGKKVKKKVSKKRKIFTERIKKLGNSLVWTPNMSVEEPNIDKQHQKLVSQINKLMQKIESGEELDILRNTLHFLSEYIEKHFTYEEFYMKKIKFPGLAEHKKVHHNFVVFFIGFQKKFNKELYSGQKPIAGEFISDKLKRLNEESKKYLALWLKKHILGMDQMYHKFAKKKGLIQKQKNAKGDISKKDMIKQKSIKGKVNVSQIAQEVKRELIQQQREPIRHLSNTDLKDKKKGIKEYIRTGVPGFDELFEQGIPKGNLMIVAGGAGSGKTILCLQTLVNKAKEGKKCLYMTLEESEDKLIQHMEDFSWNPKELIKKNRFRVWRINPFDITRNVDAMLAKQKGELLIDIDPVILPEDFSNPDFIVIDSLTAISSAFTNKDESYRIYIEQLFRFLEKTDATAFLITETEQIPKIFSPTGVEEFLADGVIVLYNIKHGNVRENALEVLKLRGAAHQKKIVAMVISDAGITVYPEQEVFSEM